MPGYSNTPTSSNTQNESPFWSKFKRETTPQIDPNELARRKRQQAESDLLQALASQNTLADSVQNYDPIPQELKPQFNRLRSTGDELSSIPLQAPTRSVEGVSGGLGVLGTMLNQTRNPKTGQVDMLAGGLGTVLATLFGDKERMGSEAARMYDQPLLDQQRQRVSDSYNTQAKVLDSQLPFVRNQAQQAIDASKIRGQAALVNAQYSQQEALHSEDRAAAYNQAVATRRNQMPQIHSIGSNGDYIIALPDGRIVQGSVGIGANPSQIRQEAEFNQRNAEEFSKAVQARDQKRFKAESLLREADELERLNTRDKNGTRRLKIIANHNEAQRLLDEADEDANSIASRFNSPSNMFVRVTKDAQGHNVLSWTGEGQEAFQNRTFTRRPNNVYRSGLTR